MTKEVCRPFHTSNGYESWLVQKAVKDDNHPKIGVEFLETFRQFHLKMYTYLNRETSRLSEKTLGVLLKEHGCHPRPLKTVCS